MKAFVEIIEKSPLDANPTFQKKGRQQKPASTHTRGSYGSGKSKITNWKKQLLVCVYHEKKKQDYAIYSAIAVLIQRIKKALIADFKISKPGKLKGGAKRIYESVSDNNVTFYASFGVEL